ncbi:High-affnity carbon uptake protein Hat/HatR [Roseivirga sp. BDSF3-8]|uniref:nSTAND1 domain-containing NTPase n=1 Tax=Roseivirga sp. BDSF3-8 TaxID=3241598 RepID=UPI003531D260
MSAVIVETLTDKHLLNNPFPGLRAFRYEESHLYFGREGQLDEVLQKLLQNQFVAVVGTSGIGKSSFMNCGLLPILHGNYPTQYASDWEIYTFRPGTSPIYNMAEALVKPLTKEGPDEDTATILKDMEYAVLSESSRGLIEAIQSKFDTEKKNHLIYIDQFEEIFRFRNLEEAASEEAAAFIKLIMNAIHQSDVPVYVVLTMRSDFVGDCSQYSQLTKAINDSQFLIPQMTRSQKEKAIVGPVKVMGGTISDRLVHQILNDVGESADQLPIMQHALMRTFDYWQRNGVGNEAMDIAHYEAIGGMGKALSIHANEAFAELSDRQKELCEKIFKTITEKGDEGRGIRRPTRLKEIAIIASAEIPELIEVVDNFRKPGRTLLMPPWSVTLTEESVIDISHESLMRIWKMLNQWVDEEYESAKLYLRLAEAAEMHQLGKASLWRPPDLQIALGWKKEENPTEEWGLRYHPAYERTMLFLEYSQKEYEKEQIIKEKIQKRRLMIARITAIVLGMGAVVALLFFLYGEMQRRKAEEQKQVAEEALIEADSQRKIASQEKEKALEQADIAQRQTEIAQSEAERATRQERVAREQTLLAQREREEADEQRLLAVEASDKALTEERKAYRLRLLSIAKSMSIKSLQMTDSVKRGLVAQQAYLFNAKNGGKQYDPDIYNGVYYALKSLNDNSYNSLNGHTENVRAIVTGRNGIMYSAGSDGRIFSWGPSSKTPVSDIYGPSDEVHKAMAYDKRHNRLVSAGDYGYLMIHNLGTNKQDKVKGDWDEIWWVAFTPDGNEVLALTSDRRIVRYDFNKLSTLSSLEDKINAIDISPDGRYIAAAGQSGKLTYIDRHDNNSTRVVYNEASRGRAGLISVAYSNGGGIIAVGNENGVIRILNTRSGSVEKTLRGHTARVNNLKFNGDDSQLASGSFDKTVRIWNTSQWEDQPIVLTDHSDWVWSIAFDSQGNRLLAGCRDNLVRIWPTDIGTMAENLCPRIPRNMSCDEWGAYVAPDIPYNPSCVARQASDCIQSDAPATTGKNQTEKSE